MRELIIPPLIINLLMFVVGLVLGIDPTLVGNRIIVSAPGGYVFQLQLSLIIFSLIAVGIGVSFVGVRVLGSGLSDSSVSIINRCVVYFITWAILSTMSFSFLSTIPTFGYIIYGTMTLLYAFGVFLGIGEIGGGGSASGKEGA